MKKEQAQADFLRESNQYLRALPNLFDGKVAILVAASVGALLFDLGLSKDLRYVGTDATARELLLFATLLGAWICCAGAVFASLASLWARTHGTLAGCASYVSIRNNVDVHAYLAEVDEALKRLAVIELATHNYELAEIAHRKVVWTNRAIAALGIGLLLTGLSVANLAIMR